MNAQVRRWAFVVASKVPSETCFCFPKHMYSKNATRAEGLFSLTSDVLGLIVRYWN